MKAFALLLLLAVGAVASDMKVEVRLNDHVGHEHSRFYMNPGDFSCAKVARTHATDGQLHSKCGFQWSLERKDHEEITVGFHGPKSHLDVAFDLKCADVIHAASAKGAKTLIHDNLAADGSSSESHHVSSSHSSLIETGNPSSLSHSEDDLSVSSHESLTHHSSSSSSSSSHGIVLATLQISDDKFLADLAQYCGHEGSESSESSHESSEGSSSESSGSDESSEGSSSGSDSGSSSSGSGSGSGDSGSGSASSFSSGGSSFGSDSLPGNSGSAISVSQSIASSSQSS